MVEVFKTNVADPCEANELVDLLAGHFPESKINFDLDDCDRILRLEGYDFTAKTVINVLEKAGLKCQVLD